MRAVETGEKEEGKVGVKERGNHSFQWNGSNKKK